MANAVRAFFCYREMIFAALTVGDEKPAPFPAHRLPLIFWQEQNSQAQTTAPARSDILCATEASQSFSSPTVNAEGIKEKFVGILDIRRTALSITNKQNARVCEFCDW